MGRDTVPGFGQRLKELREAAGLTQRELAAAADSHYTTIATYEADRRTPGLKMLIALAEALGVDLNAMDPRKRRRR